VAVAVAVLLRPTDPPLEAPSRRPIPPSTCTPARWTGATEVGHPLPDIPGVPRLPLLLPPLPLPIRCPPTRFRTVPRRLRLPTARVPAGFPGDTRHPLTTRPILTGEERATMATTGEVVDPPGICRTIPTGMDMGMDMDINMDINMDTVNMDHRDRIGAARLRSLPCRPRFPETVPFGCRPGIPRAGCFRRRTTVPSCRGDPPS